MFYDLLGLVTCQYVIFFLWGYLKDKAKPHKIDKLKGKTLEKHSNLERHARKYRRQFLLATSVYANGHKT